MEERQEAARSGQTGYPDLRECERLWKAHETPAHIIEHCKAVSRTAVLMAEALNRAGMDLNVQLVRSAGWLHDIVRLADSHWEKGAAIALDNGYPDVAAIVSEHMSHQIPASAKQVNECDLVCLADRMVKENQFVGLDERMDYIIEKSRQYDGAEARIRNSFKSMRSFKADMEQTMGCTVEELMK